MSFSRSVLSAFVVLIALVSCKPVSTPPAGSTAPHDASQVVLKRLHHAAEEMALDGFQFDKPTLGWPHDVGAASSEAYLAVLRDNHYLDGEIALRIDVANVAETDALDTALFRIRDSTGSEIVIRKDGVIDPAAKVSPRHPAWLP